jgi:hypothetical protein
MIEIDAGQVGTLRPIGNRPVSNSEFRSGPIANRPQDAILPHMERFSMFLARRLIAAHLEYLDHLQTTLRDAVGGKAWNLVDRIQNIGPYEVPGGVRGTA